MSFSIEDLVKAAIEAWKFGAPKAKAFFNIRKEIRSELVLNINLLNKIISNPSQDNTELIKQLKTLRLSTAKEYLELSNIGKYYICRSRVSAIRAKRFKAPFVLKKSFEEVTRAYLISLEELYREDIIPSKDIRIRLVNIRKRFLVCKDMIAV